MDLTIECVVALSAAIAGGVTGYRFLLTTPPDIGWAAVSWAGTVLGIGAIIARALWKNAEDLKRDEPHALNGVLHTLYAAITDGLGCAEDHDLRLCIFVPHPNKADMVLQLTDYVSKSAPCGRNRSIPTRCGVVGKCLRSGDAQYDPLPNNVQRVDHLVAEHGFERDEARLMKEDRKSWAAIPVGEPERVVAIIFLDSSKRDFFGRSNSPRRKILQSAVIGVAAFLDRQ